MENLVNISHISKSYGKTAALSDVSITIPAGKIIGLIGPNGSGKTTLLRAMTGLISYEGNISVMDIEPKTQRPQLMSLAGVIHDISVLPPWMTIRQVLEFVEGMKPEFNREKCQKILEKTAIKIESKVKHLSKGMKTQLHLALVLATETRLLILDEPTHGLDILFRKELYANVLEDYFDTQKSVIISTHQVEEVEHILTDVIFIRDGRVILFESMEALNNRYCQIIASDDQIDKIRDMSPISESRFFGKSVFLMENVKKDDLEQFGEVKTPSIADIFVAIMGGQA